MINCAHYITPENRILNELNVEQIKEYLANGQGLLWVDIAENTAEDGQFLTDVFGFHPLAIADCISKNLHPPKIDEFEDHIFVIVHGINYNSESDIVGTTEIALFIGKNYVVSSHDLPLRSVNAIMQRVIGNGRPMKRGPDMLAHDILDALVDNIMPTIDGLDEKCTSIEAEVVEHPKKETLSAILLLKRSILALNRVISPQREVIGSLARGDYPFVSDKAQIYYRNIYDHLVRIETLTQNLRDLADSALSTYLSSVSNRMNEVMKVLSVVAAVFLPLALVAGIYGMNFTYMPELSWRYGYFGTLTAMVVVAVSLIIIFKKRRWL